MRKKLHIATVAKDAAKLAEEYKIGVELDQYCMAENMEIGKFEQVDEAVRKIIEQAKVPSLILHAPFNELHPAAIDYKVRDIAYERYERAYEIAQSYSVEKMVIHSGYLPYVYFKEWHHEKSVDFWKTYMKDKPETFVICIENVLEDEPYMMAKIAEEIDRPNIRLCLDIGHANCMSSVPIKDWIKAMSPHLGHVHIHNNNGEHDFHRPVQDGTIDIVETLECIEKYCSEGVSLTIESLDGRTSLEWLDKEGYLK